MRTATPTPQNRSTSHARVRAPAVICAAALTALPAAADTDPPVFSQTPFHEAVEQSREARHILVVMATAEWCGPCQTMKNTTWKDERVEQWFGQHGVAIQLDVDEHPDLSSELRVRAMPTTIAFKHGEEFDRVRGYQNADQFIAWLDNVREGKRRVDALLERAEQDPDGLEPEERFTLARELSEAARHDLALEHLLRLWQDADSGDRRFAIRRSALVSETGALIREHEPAREPFAAVRDEIEQRMREQGPTWDDLRAWVGFNSALSQHVKTLEWFDRIKGDDESAATLRYFRSDLSPILLSHDRTADLAYLVTDPREIANEEMRQLAFIRHAQHFFDDAQQHAEAVAHFENTAHENIGRWYAALLTQGRDEDAALLLRTAIEIDDTEALRIAAVEWALRFDQPRRAHAEILEPAAANSDQARRLHARVVGLLDE